MWESGLRGKSWRILKNLSQDLKAIVKTKYGPTRTINMEIGGKQGSRLTGRMFAKMMDTLAEDLQPTKEGFKFNNDFIISVLLWVDDVVSCVEGTENQLLMLPKIADFAIKHKLRWGASKCKVMRIGKHRDPPRHWELGELEIQETESYKYLGNLITNDGKNAKNLDERKRKLAASTTTINAIAETAVLRSIETPVILQLHEKINISALLINCESWNLNKSERAILEKIEIQTMKYLFDFSSHTPTPAILFMFGMLYTGHQLDKRRLIYLHRILKRRDHHWTKKALFELEKLNIGWSKNIKETLGTYDLPIDYNTIKTMTKRQWVKLVSNKVEVKNTRRLIDDCFKSVNGVKIAKTKTAHILDNLTDDTYQRNVQPEIMSNTKQVAKTLILACFGSNVAAILRVP